MDGPRKCKQDSPGYLAKQPPVQQLSKMKPRSLTNMAKEGLDHCGAALQKVVTKTEINQHIRILVPSVERPR